MNHGITNEMISQITNEMADFRALFGPNPIRDTSAAYYRWKIYDNPFGTGFIHLEKREGRTVGSTTLSRRRIAVNGVCLSAAEIGEAFTLPDFRRQGIFLKGVRACMQYASEQGIDLIYATPNPQSLPGFINKLGFVMNPNISWQSLVKHLSSPGTLLKGAAGCLATRHPIQRMKRLGRMIRYQRIRRARLASLSSLDIHTQTAADFPYEVNGLWKLDHPTFCMFRDRLYLRWRFVDNPDSYCILTALKQDEPVGCLALKLYESQRCGILCDFITQHGDKDILALLVSQAEQYLVDLGYRSSRLTCVQSGLYYDDLVSLGYENSGQNRMTIVFHGRPEITDLLKNGLNWHFTLADSDNI